MDRRLYPISLDFFNATILPLIEDSDIWKGRPQRLSHYQVFCAILYVLRTGVPWRGLPVTYGKWHPKSAGVCMILLASLMANPGRYQTEDSLSARQWLGAGCACTHVKIPSVS